MNLRLPLWGFVMGVLFSTCHVLDDEFNLPEDAPNFILIITDDQRFDALGVAQGQQGRISRFPWLQLPTLDSLAATGTYFKNAFVTTSLCSPSRASILTGQYTRSHGIRSNNDQFNMASFASELKRFGYYTGYFGKWHMGNQSGPRPGFDHSYSFIGQGEYFDADFQYNGKAYASQGWVDAVSTDHLIDKLDHIQDQPFCFVLGMKSSHGPWNKPPKITENYFVGDTIYPVPNYSSLPLSVIESGINDEIDIAMLHQYIVYFRYLAAVDLQVKKIVDELRLSGLSKNTYLFFMSDNGFFMGEHQIRIDKRLAYEESIRIPFFISGPKAASHVNESLVLNVDVCPTLLDLAGVPNRLSTQGKSLVPLLDQSASGLRDYFVYEYYKESIGIQTDILAVRNDRYKLIRYQEYPEWDELFDLVEDPYETTNLIAHPTYQGVVDQLDKKLVESL